MVHSTDGNTDKFNMVAGVLTEDTILFMICLDYVLRMSIDLKKEKGLTLKRT